MLVKKRIKGSKLVAILSFILSGLFSVSGFAFTLGDIRLDSALNEPLEASIELLDLEGLDESQILVSLGSEADFQRVGVAPLPLLNELDFDVEVFSASEGVVRISSNEVIIEPYLNFVLNVRWPSGRVIREYTVLLDLPTFSANPVPAPAPAPAQIRSTPTPQPAAPTPAPRPQVAGPEPEAQVAEPRQSLETNQSAETVVIQPGDSMWDIALATRPDNGVSVQQMMIAIQQSNSDSDAFINNNINGIRTGRVLRIPDRQEIETITLNQAVNQVAVQNQQFSGGQPLAVNNTRGNVPVTRDELSIINSPASEPGQNGQIGGLNDTIRALENELALNEESLDAARLENQELRSRLGDMEEQIGILENIIAIEDQRMAELQTQLAEQANVVAVTDTSTPAPAPTPQTVNTPAADDTSLTAQVTNFLGSTLGMGLALLVLLALVVGFLVARNRSAGNDDEDDFDPIYSDQEDVDDEEVEESGENEQSVFSPLLDEEEFADAAEEDERIDDELNEYESDTDTSDTEDADSTDDYAGEFDDDEEEDEGEKAGFLAGFFARFSRKKSTEDDEELDFDSDEETQFDVEDDTEDTDESDFLDEEDPRINAALEDSSDEIDPDVGQEASDVSKGLNSGTDIDDEQDDEEVVLRFDALDKQDTFASTDEEPEQASSEEGKPAQEAEELFEFKLDDSPVQETSSLSSESDNETEESVESFEFSVDDSPVEKIEAESSESDEDDLETFDFGSLSLDDAGDDNAETAEADSEEIVFIDEADESSEAAPKSQKEEVTTKGTSSLGNLGFDNSLIDDDDEEELEMITDQDEASTKLDLAVAYQAMEDLDGAREILEEVIAEGNDDQVAEAKRLLEEWSNS